MNALLFDIEEFAVFDGPGVRKTIFFKGCPLRCEWCHNPEGLEFKKQIMISHNKCINCGKCKSICENSHCILCEKCVKLCPVGAIKISGYEISSNELAENILKDADCYKNMDGGITFSGGEPLLQGDFILELLEKIKGVHCAIETCGYASETIFSSVCQKMDLVIIDIKIMDNIRHKEYTKKDNGKIINNVKWLCNSNIPFIVRIPLIPNVNDDEENMHKTCELLKNAKSLLHIELLPYHKTAGAKYSMLNLQYKPNFSTDTIPKKQTHIIDKYKIRWKVL